MRRVSSPIGEGRLVDRARQALARSGTLPADEALRLAGYKALRLWEDLLDLQGGGSLAAAEPLETTSVVVRLRRASRAAFCDSCCYTQCDPHACVHACHAGAP